MGIKGMTFGTHSMLGMIINMLDMRPNAAEKSVKPCKHWIYCNYQVSTDLKYYINGYTYNLYGAWVAYTNHCIYAANVFKTLCKDIKGVHSHVSIHN